MLTDASGEVAEPTCSTRSLCDPGSASVAGGSADDEALDDSNDVGDPAGAGYLPCALRSQT